MTAVHLELPTSAQPHILKPPWHLAELGASLFSHVSKGMRRNLLQCRDRGNLLGHLTRSFIWIPQKVKFFWYLSLLCSVPSSENNKAHPLQPSAPETLRRQELGTPPFGVLMPPPSVYCWGFHKHLKYYLEKNATVQASLYRTALGILSILWNCINRWNLVRNYS